MSDEKAYSAEDGWQPFKIDAIWTEQDDPEQPPVFGIATRMIGGCSQLTGDEFATIRTRGPLFAYYRDWGNGQYEVAIAQETTQLKGTYVSEMRIMHGPELRARFDPKPDGGEAEPRCNNTTTTVDHNPCVLGAGHRSGENPTGCQSLQAKPSTP